MPFHLAVIKGELKDMDKPWQDDFYFMKHILDRVSYTDDMYAGGQGRPEAMADLVSQVQLRAKRTPESHERTSRMLHFQDFLSRIHAMHPEVETFLRDNGRIA